MEYCPGGDLAGLLDRLGKPLPEKDAVFYIAEIIQALHDVHNLGFIHRDVKPDNILLDRFIFLWCEFKSCMAFYYKY